MSKWIRTLGAAAAALTAGVAIAGAALTVTDVNNRVKELLAPFLNEHTAIEVKFTHLDVDAVRVQKAGMTARFAKSGQVNSLELAVPALRYTYKGDNGLPSFVGGANLDMDLLKSLPHSMLNELADAAQEIVEGTLKGMAAEYGAAAVVDAKVDELTRDKNQNVTSVRMHADIRIDLSKLPENVSLENVPLVNARLDFEAHLNGIMLAAEIELNPTYRGFQQDQQGLKELVEKLLSNDKSTYEQLEMAIGWVDSLAGDLVNRGPEERLE
jgi:hypothetical protein